MAAAHPDKPRPEVTTLAKYRNPDMSVVPTAAGDQLVRRQRACMAGQQRSCCDMQL